MAIENARTVRVLANPGGLIDFIGTGKYRRRLSRSVKSTTASGLDPKLGLVLVAKDDHVDPVESSGTSESLFMTALTWRKSTPTKVAALEGRLTDMNPACGTHQGQC